MRFTKKKKVLLSVMLLSTLSLSGIFLTNQYLKQKVDERKKRADITLSLFRDQLTKEVNNKNLAKYLTYSLEQAYDPSLTLFEEKAKELLENDHKINFIAYFKGDDLQTIYPIEYSEWKGKSLSEFSYSYTLAKVIKKDVVEGPLRIKQMHKKVFLFASPLLIENNYAGEIIVAYDAQYVIKQFNLEQLEKAGYDYELWTVNELGEHKTIIQTSNKAEDFSGAVKQSFSLPANWNISIQPQKGWLSNAEIELAYVTTFGLMVLSLAVVYLCYLHLKTKEKIQLANYTDPNCGLLNFMGFHHILNQTIYRKSLTTFYLLYIRLNGLHSLLPVMNEREMTQYYQHLHKEIHAFFGERVVSGRLSDESVVIAVYGNWDKDKLIHAVEEFRLSLLLKKKVKDKKMFIEPQICFLTYPEDGENAAQLIEKAQRCYQEQYENVRK